jgi:hypothetical protein
MVIRGTTSSSWNMRIIAASTPFWLRGRVIEIWHYWESNDVFSRLHISSFYRHSFENSNREFMYWVVRNDFEQRSKSLFTVYPRVNREQFTYDVLWTSFYLDTLDNHNLLISKSKSKTNLILRLSFEVSTILLLSSRAIVVLLLGSYVQRKQKHWWLWSSRFQYIPIYPTLL